MKTIKIATDFSDTPLGRFAADSEFNGTRFREEFLVPALRSGEPVEVNLDDVEGYGSSFLEEAFGGLVREGYFTADDLQRNLKVVSLTPDCKIYIPLIWKHIHKAKVVNK